MLTFRALLHQMKNSNTIIDTVYTFDTHEMEGEPNIIGVTVVEVGFDFVIFNQPGSGATGAVLVPIDKIVSMDY
ncbi:hypothetical protein IQ283_16590 [Alkalihalobacillus hwajinpoensis]|uniref:hypothetical protein n=1 Tax=Guptibacillus hwajinpoensis TaxID=208199 RepID=UPI0018834A35|nr:hypothetical protein [Pseudalkalibacillus hwajinpoensis]MBF0708221.1 hypothetical protein [Pseudalkalibacillus hwajinpoensis]